MRTVPNVKKVLSEYLRNGSCGTYSEILLSHKTSSFESVLVRWMNLETSLVVQMVEPVIQSKVSQKEENKYLGINAYIWTVEKWY